MRIPLKSLTIALTLSVCGFSGYIIYKILKESDTEEDDMDDPLVKALKLDTRVVSVPNEYLFIVLGRNGNDSKALEEETNTTITFSPGKTFFEKNCTIKGAKDDVIKAEQKILSVINSDDVIDIEKMFIPKKYVDHMQKRLSVLCNRSGCIVDIAPAEIKTNPDLFAVFITGSRKNRIVATALIYDETEYLKSLEEPQDGVALKRKKCTHLQKVDTIKEENFQSDSRFFEVFVSAVVDPSKFWVQLVGLKANQLDRLVEEMTDFYNNSTLKDTPSKCTKFMPGDLVAAIFKYDNKWYRGEILQVEEKKARALVYYLDYGDTDYVPLTNIQELRTEYLKLHYQAIECHLSRVVPVDEKWSPEAVDKFEDLAQVARWKQLTARVNKYSNKLKTRASMEMTMAPGIDLLDVVDGNEFDIANELVKAGYAKFVKDVDSRPMTAPHKNSLKLVD